MQTDHLSLGNRLSWLPGVYIIHEHAGKVTGHTVTLYKGRTVVHTFSRCTLGSVIEHAERLLDSPNVYRLTVTEEG